MKFLSQPANNVVYFHFKFHQNRTRFSAVFPNSFIHSLKFLCVYVEFLIIGQALLKNL